MPPHSRDVWTVRTVDSPWQDILQDLRVAVRARRSDRNGHRDSALALGIGANNAIFSLVNSLLLRTLPVAGPERLVMLRLSQGNTAAWTYGLRGEIRWRAPQKCYGAVAWSAPVLRSD